MSMQSKPREGGSTRRGSRCASRDTECDQVPASYKKNSFVMASRRQCVYQLTLFPRKCDALSNATGERQVPSSHSARSCIHSGYTGADFLHFLTLSNYYLALKAYLPRLLWLDDEECKRSSQLAPR